MDEVTFWTALEYRVCREFAGMSDNRLRHLWCDGFIPGEYRLDDHTPRITGRAWIGDELQESEWEFTLLLPVLFRSRDEINWASLLPPEEETRWLSVDEAGRRIEIEPRRVREV